MKPHRSMNQIESRETFSAQAAGCGVSGPASAEDPVFNTHVKVLAGVQHPVKKFVQQFQLSGDVRMVQSLKGERDGAAQF